MENDVEYRDIPGFPGYRAGSDGSLWTSLKSRFNKLAQWKQLEKAANKDGYIRIRLRRDGKSVSFTAHKIIALTFLGERPPGLIVCHNDGNPLNNKVTNLRYATYKDNSHDSLIHGTLLFGEKSRNAKLKRANVIAMREMYANGVPVGKIAANLGVNYRNVSRIIRKERWAHV